MIPPEPAVVTARGPVPASHLGVTLMHEHVLVDLMREHRLDGLLNDVPLAIEELSRFKAAGGSAVVEVTNRSMGQQPAMLKRISEATGLHVVLGCGLYRQPYLEPWLDRTSTGELAERFLRDITEGIDGSGVRPGIIGEIACDQWITALEERVFRAAARAQRASGLALTTHAARWPVGLAQLDLLESEGVDPGRVVIGHCDTVSSSDWETADRIFAYHLQLARRGAYVELDLIRPTRPGATGRDLELRARYVLSLLEKGHGHQVLLSQDVCFRSDLHANGGGGYDFLLAHFVPRLRELGVSEDEVRMLLVDNPRRALAGA